MKPLNSLIMTYLNSPIKNNLFLFFIALLFYFIPTEKSYAQDICRYQEPIYNININASPLTYDYSKYAKDIRNQSEHLLGAFKKNSQISLNTVIGTTSYNGIQCQILKQVNITIFFTLEISISKEAQQFKCTYDRVLNHEHMHYNIDIQAIHSLNNNIYRIAKDSFNTIPVTYNGEMKSLIKKQQEIFNQYVSNYLTLNTKDSHNKLDTAENYQYESTFCSNKENNELLYLLNKN